MGAFATRVDRRAVESITLPFRCLGGILKVVRLLVMGGNQSIPKITPRDRAILE